MAGYYLYSIRYDVFSQLTTTPTKEQGLLIADSLLGEEGEYELCLEEFDDESAAANWPLDRETLGEVIINRLASTDWYSDLCYDSSILWDYILRTIFHGDFFNIDFQCSDYESIYWDVAELAEKQGAAMMGEPAFGGSGFRWHKKKSRFGWLRRQVAGYSPDYTIYKPQQSRKLLKELNAVKSYFSSLAENEEGSPREQFFEGLLPVVKNVVVKDRVLWVSTDT